jgi:hypothetical protein
MKPAAGDRLHVHPLVPPPATVRPQPVVDDDVDGDAEPETAAAAVDAETADEQPKLTAREEQILVFERKWWKHAGAKEQAIRDTFDLSATRYYQVLNTLLDNPAALVFDPILVGRLRRLRSTRARARGIPRPPRSS